MEVENVISQIDGIKNVKVVGVKAAVIQEEVVACIVWKDNEKHSQKEVIEFVKNQIADYKVPKYVFDFDELPLNSSGKVLSNVLSEICYKKINED